MNFFETDGLRLAYLDEGEGLPVLCLPGLTRNSADFDDLAAALDRDVRLIRPTYRGRAESQWAEDFMTYNVAQEAKDAIALLDHLGVEKALFIGTSRGGLISMITGVIAKERMLGAVLNDVGPRLAEEGLAKIMVYLGIPPKAKDFDEAAEIVAEFNREEFPDIPLSFWRKGVERWFSLGPDGIGLLYDPRLRDAMVKQSEGPAPDLWPLFDSLHGLPLGLIRGMNSDLLTEEIISEMLEHRPDMLVARVPNRGHIPFLNEPEAIELIHEMIDRVSQ